MTIEEFQKEPMVWLEDEKYTFIVMISSSSRVDNDRVWVPYFHFDIFGYEWIFFPDIDVGDYTIGHSRKMNELPKMTFHSIIAVIFDGVRK